MQCSRDIIALTATKVGPILAANRRLHIFKRVEHLDIIAHDLFNLMLSINCIQAFGSNDCVRYQSFLVKASDFGKPAEHFLVLFINILVYIRCCLNFLEFSKNFLVMLSF